MSRPLRYKNSLADASSASKSTVLSLNVVMQFTYTFPKNMNIRNLWYFRIGKKSVLTHPLIVKNCGFVVLPSVSAKADCRFYCRMTSEILDTGIKNGAARSPQPDPRNSSFTTHRECLLVGNGNVAVIEVRRDKVRFS